jgi:hypothetical protein
MLKEEVVAEINRDPFIPLRLHLRNRKTIKIPFRDAAWLIGGGVLVFIGKKQGKPIAKGYDRFPFDAIVRIEKIPSKSNGQRRRKAS